MTGLPTNFGEALLGDVSIRRLFVTLMASLIFLASVAGAVESGQVEYIGGTVPGLKEGALGKLDMVSETALRFEATGTVLEIPYARIESFDYTQEVSHHLGVLPAIAVGLMKSRKHKHFFRISFDKDAAKEVVIFEVSKSLQPTLLAVLKTRAPALCKSAPSHCRQ
jgi:hypothetical protein